LISAPCIKVPSPQEIRNGLFPKGVLKPVPLPPVWRAQILLTPFGGLSGSATVTSDQLVIGNLTYDASSPTERFMRFSLYLLEDLNYYDFLFRTSGGQTQWWWLISDPGDPNGLPTKAFGPFTTAAAVPVQDFLASNDFSHAGTWNVLGRLRDAFSARRDAKVGTWYWFDSGTDNPARIMNIDGGNDFQIAVLGAYYLADLPTFRGLSSSTLADVYKLCSTATSLPTPPSPMLTLSDILNAMAAPPAGSQMQCTLNQIQALIPGISRSAGAVTPPSWTNRVNSECYMIGPAPYPYYSQVWYDWNRGTQVTVLVNQDEAGAYSERVDWVLPKATTGPRIYYSWKNSAWTPECCEAQGGLVAMPVPNFVEAGDGRCRAIVSNNPYFGTLSIWSVALGKSGDWEASFWYWFDDQQKGVIFSLAPPHFLTLIDYQTFIQNGVIQACIFDNPCDQLPACPPPKIVTAQNLRNFMPLAFTLW
jgi:hypothetical protein